MVSKTNFPYHETYLYESLAKDKGCLTEIFHLKELRIFLLVSRSTPTSLVVSKMSSTYKNNELTPIDLEYITNPQHSLKTKTCYNLIKFQEPLTEACLRL